MITEVIFFVKNKIMNIFGIKTGGILNLYINVKINFLPFDVFE